MSQQGAGADDWWQKLYEDPDPGAEAAAGDPGDTDTLDHRFRSAAVLVTDPAAGPEPAPAPDSAEAGTDAAAATGAASGAGARTAPGAVPGAGALPAAGTGAADRRHAGSVVPGPRQEAVPPPPPPPSPLPPPGPLLPPPRDPREGGPTWYALGDVAVPPAPPAEEPEPPAAPAELPVWSWGPQPPASAAAPEAPATRPEAETVVVPVPPAAATPTAPAAPAAPAEPPSPDPRERPEVRHLGDRAPTYAAEPGALPAADPAALDAMTPDTVLEGARYGSYTLRAASLRGDSARFRGEARRDFLLTARFGTGPDALVLVALAGGDRAAPGAAAAAAEVCRTVAAAVGRSQERLADDIRAGRRDALRSGLQRLTDRGYGRLRARASELGLEEAAYTAGLRGLLLPVDPQCRTRVAFGAGAGGLFRLREGRWQDLEPAGPDEDPGKEATGAEGGIPFLFRASVARPGDTVLLCSGGLADPMREEGLLAAELAARWSEGEPPGLAAFLADAQLRLKGYADDRTAAAVWEA
ncbi:protein phosphatase 2C domain-containing protein [Streptomyces sp. NPDC048340]|uniref:protein phosphatase 2C domain-containing protein n=1 Tax=Streptomyces sp. NPDC048340 TaxID=3365537 RepID=UPI00371C9706